MDHADFLAEACNDMLKKINRSRIFYFQAMSFVILSPDYSVQYVCCIGEITYFANTNLGYDTEFWDFLPTPYNDLKYLA